MEMGGGGKKSPRRILVCLCWKHLTRPIGSQEKPLSHVDLIHKIRLFHWVITVKYFALIIQSVLHRGKSPFYQFSAAKGLHRLLSYSFGFSISFSPPFSLTDSMSFPDLEITSCPSGFSNPEWMLIEMEMEPAGGASEAEGKGRGGKKFRNMRPGVRGPKTEAKEPKTDLGRQNNGIIVFTF